MGEAAHHATNPVSHGEMPYRGSCLAWNLGCWDSKGRHYEEGTGTRTTEPHPTASDPKGTRTLQPTDTKSGTLFDGVRAFLDDIARQMLPGRTSLIRHCAPGIDTPDPRQASQPTGSPFHWMRPRAPIRIADKKAGVERTVNRAENGIDSP